MSTVFVLSLSLLFVLLIDLHLFILSLYWCHWQIIWYHHSDKHNIAHFWIFINYTSWKIIYSTLLSLSLSMVFEEHRLLNHLHSLEDFSMARVSFNWVWQTVNWTSHCLCHRSPLLLSWLVFLCLFIVVLLYILILVFLSISH